MRYAYNPTTGVFAQYNPADHPGGLPSPWVESTQQAYEGYLSAHMPAGNIPTGEPTGATPPPEVATPTSPSTADLTRIRAHYYEDLRIRGGDWVVLANYFWTQTTSMTDIIAIETLYRKLFDQGVSGNFNVGGISTGGPTIPDQVGWPTGEFAASFPQAAWEKAFGLPSFGQNPFQQWLASQAAPTYAAWLGRENLPTTLVPTDSFESFLTRGGGERAGGVGLETLRRARGLAPEEQEEWLGQLGGEAGGLASLTALLRAALGAGGRGFATPIASMKAARLGNLQRAWTRETAGGETGPTFLDFLMQKYGLG